MIQQAPSFADSCDKTRTARLQEVCRQHVLETRRTPHGISQNLDLQAAVFKPLSDYRAMSSCLVERLEVSRPLLGRRAMIAQVPLLRSVHKD